MSFGSPRRRARPFGQPPPFDPRSGTFFPTVDDEPLVECEIEVVGHDALLCLDRDGRRLLVAKPWQFRRSTFHGQTFYGVAFASTGLDTRNATPTGEDPQDEELRPPYFAGEKIMAWKREGRDTVMASVGSGELGGVAAGTHRVQWEDANTTGRAWSGPGTERAEGPWKFAIVRSDSSAVSPTSGWLRSSDTSGVFSSLRVDVYGATFASLSLPATLEDQTATNGSVVRYMNGEVVAVRSSGGGLSVSKVHRSGLDPLVGAGDLWVRPEIAIAGSKTVLMDAACDYRDVVDSLLGASSSLYAVASHDGAYRIPCNFSATDLFAFLPVAGKTAAVVLSAWQDSAPSLVDFFGIGDNSAQVDFRLSWSGGQTMDDTLMFSPSSQFSVAEWRGEQASPWSILSDPSLGGVDYTPQSVDVPTGTYPSTATGTATLRSYLAPFGDTDAGRRIVPAGGLAAGYVTGISVVLKITLPSPFTQYWSEETGAFDGTVPVAKVDGRFSPPTPGWLYTLLA